MGACSSRAADRAEQRKKNWSRTGLIGLKGAGLKALPPDALAALPAAVSLALARNRLPALPAELARAARLARLDARDNGLAGPDALAPAARLPALKWLAVAGNRGLGALPPLDLPCLEELDAARCGLAAGPGPACRLPALTTLCLAGNHLATFEPGDWPALKALDLSDNQLTSLPGSLCRLTGLRVLRLDGNAGLATLPAGLLSSLPHLHTLGLDRTRVTAAALREADTPAFAAYEARRRGKHERALAGGALLGPRGLDEGIAAK